MDDPFEHLTEAGRRVLQHASHEAQRLHHNYVGTEHLLLGLAREDEGVTAKVLANLGVELEKLRRAVEFIIRRGVPSPSGDVGLTPRAHTVLALALEDARRLGQAAVEPEHLLLGLVHEGEGMAAGVLESLGLVLERVWEQTLESLGVPPGERPEPPHPRRGHVARAAGLLWVQPTVRARASFRAQATGPPPGAADRFDKLTDRARRVLQLAHEEAQRLNHNYIGTEHLLLGLVREGQGVAAKVLGDLGVKLDDVRSAVELTIGRGAQTVAGDIGLTPRAKRAIELSVDEARRLNHHYIGTEHLLLGLVREGEGIAASVLQSLGVSLDRVRSQIVYVLNLPAAESTAASRVQPTSEAAGVLEEAQLAARWFRHARVGPGHLLLGLVRQEQGDAARLLAEAGIDLGSAVAAFDAAVGWGSEPAPGVPAPFEEAATAALEAARHAADRRNHRLATTHLLLGLLGLPDEASSSRMLRHLGASRDRLREVAERHLSAGPGT
jgi:ATP-dependent Clp protease ATP-binding subunit ClpA